MVGLGCKIIMNWVMCPAWKGLGADVDSGARVLSDLLDLDSILANDGAALRGGHQQVEAQPFVVSTVPAPVPVSSLLPTLQGLADQSIRLERHVIQTIIKATTINLEDGVSWTVHCDDSLLLRGSLNPDLGSTLISDIVDHLSPSADDAACLGARDDGPQGDGHLTVAILGHGHSLSLQLSNLFVAEIIGKIVVLMCVLLLLISLMTVAVRALPMQYG